MTVSHEETACSYKADPPYARTLKVLLSPQLQGEVDGFAAGFAILSPGGKSNYARHREGEVFCVVSGSGEIRAKECSYPVKPGSMVWCLPWEYHQLVNTGDKTMKVLWLLIPPGREGAIIELSRKKEDGG